MTRKREDGTPPLPLTTESPTTHTTDQHHVPIDPRAAELMHIHAARLALTRSVPPLHARSVSAEGWFPTFPGNRFDYAPRLLQSVAEFVTYYLWCTLSNPGVQFVSSIVNSKPEGGSAAYRFPYFAPP